MRNCAKIIVVAFANVLFSFSGQANAPPTLDLSKYRETFSETFRGKLDVTPWGPSKWIAHTPWHGDFGDAAFVDPTEGFPFVTGRNGLRIFARKDINGKWKSGLLSSVDVNGNGFSQVDGYFEARMKMPPGPGVWPAFWLVADGGKDYKAEIDPIEYYGGAPEEYHAGYILWPKQGQVQGGDGKIIPSSAGPLSNGFHTYGIEILDKELVYYFDRNEVARFPAAPAMHNPMSILVNLALGSGWPIDKTPNPSILQVDYIKAFKKK